jgi:hypothetical protein
MYRQSGRSKGGLADAKSGANGVFWADQLEMVIVAALLNSKNRTEAAFMRIHRGLGSVDTRVSAPAYGLHESTQDRLQKASFADGCELPAGPAARAPVGFGT